MRETKCIGGLSDHIWGTQYHQQDRVYSMGQCALALPAQIPEGSYKYMEIKIIGNMDHTMDNTFESANRVYGRDGISPTLPTAQGGGIVPKIVDIVAMRGREDPSSSSECGWEQRLEINPEGISNAITTVQKDNLVLSMENIPSAIKEWTWEINGEIYLIGIRKLTPRECWRLMGFTDEDYEKAESVNSNTQLYKQAGNSIVVNVLEAIFMQMLGRT